MGSFTSAPQIKNVDCQDDKLEISDGMSIPDLIEYCRFMRGEDRPQLVKRKFLRPDERTGLQRDLAEGFRMLKLDAISKSEYDGEWDVTSGNCECILLPKRCLPRCSMQ